MMATSLIDRSTHGRHRAMVQTLVCKEHGVFNEDGARPQDEGGEEVDVDVVSRAPKLSANPNEPAQ